MRIKITVINYPYPCDPPYVPDDNPCGIYERDFELGDIWGKVYFVLSAWRAPTDNDRNIKVRWGTYNVWEGECLDRQFSKVYGCSVQDGCVTVSGSMGGVSRLPYFRYTMTVSVTADGRITNKINGTVREDTIWLPRFGMEWVLPAEFEKFSYFGSGPIESYSDMDHAASVGIYESTAADEYVNYVRPQEHGNHNKVKWLTIGDMEFTCGKGMEINVSRYSSSAVDAAEHTDELFADGKIHLRTDYKVSGIGSGSCGPQLEEKYRLSEKEINFEFGLAPKK